MRVAFLVSEFPDLSETFVLNQITGLIEAGHEVDIYARRAAENPKVHADSNRYGLLSRTYYRENVPANGEVGIRGNVRTLFRRELVSNPRSFIQLFRVLRRNGLGVSSRTIAAALPYLGKAPYDIVHCHFGPNGLLGMKLRAKGLIQGKLVTTFYGYDASAFVSRRGADVYAKLFQDGDMFIAISDFIRSRIEEIGCPQDRIVKLPIGIDPRQYTFRERQLRPGETVKILTVARLVEKKGIHYSIQAVAEVAKEHPRIIYKIVGDGPLREELQDLIHRLGLRDRIELLGWMTQEEIRELCADAHIFVLASTTGPNNDQEGLGLVLVEAQAMGLPVLSTRHNGIPEAVLDGQSGYLVPERDVAGLAERLAHLVKHPESWSRMGRKGRTFVEQAFDVKKLNKSLVQIYNAVLKNSVRTDG